MTGAITVSELAVADPFFSLLGGIRARREALRREWAYASQTSMRAKAKPLFVHECMKAIAELDEMEDLLDNPSPITNELNPSDALGLQAGASLDASNPARSVRMHAQGHSNEENVTACVPHGNAALASTRKETGIRPVISPVSRFAEALGSATGSQVFKEVRKRFRALGTVSEQKAMIFGLDVHNRRGSITERWLQVVMDKLKSKGAQARLAEHKWRMIEEVTLRAEQGWYIVFNTLTVDNNNYESVFEKGSRAWSYYIREIDTVVGNELYPNIRAAVSAKKDDPFHIYFAIVERGKLRGRLHIHVIHCLKTIPGSWKKDPNLRPGPAANRQCYAMKKLWIYGHSMPIACRFSDFDAWGRLGWCWPVVKDGRTYKPIPSKPPIAIARYMCKYLLKAYTSPKGVYQWRTRISSGFGLHRMRRIVSTIPREVLWAYLKGFPTRIKVGDMTLPTSRLRVECLRSLLKHQRSGSPESAESLSLLRMIRKSLKEVSPQKPIVERLRSMMRATPSCSSPSITPFVVRSLNDTGAFDVGQAFRAAYERPTERFRAKGGSPRRGIL